MRYEGMIYRPPSEAYSLIVQVTIGCSQNHCIFCNMFKEKSFRINSSFYSRKISRMQTSNLIWITKKYLNEGPRRIGQITTTWNIYDLYGIRIRK